MNPRDVAVVAEYEVTESVRSKRVLILMLLYVTISVIGSLAFIGSLHKLEQEFIERAGLSASTPPGVVTEKLLQYPGFVDLMEWLVEDRAVAEELVTLPPLAVFYGWLAMACVPIVVVLTASDTVSTELSSGATRFQLLRVNRLTYSVGKLLGQGALMLASVLVGAAAAFLTGLLRMPGLDPLPTALSLLSFSLRAGFIGFAFVGLSVGVSHVTRSVPLSRAFGLLAFIGALSLYGITGLMEDGKYASFAEIVRTLLPWPHKSDLWRVEIMERLPGASMLVALGIGYFALGYLYRARRDA